MAILDLAIRGISHVRAVMADNRPHSDRQALPWQGAEIAAFDAIGSRVAD